MDSSACEAVYSTNFISRSRDFLLMIKINYADKNDKKFGNFTHGIVDGSFVC